VIYQYPLTANPLAVPYGTPIHVGPDPTGIPCLWMQHTQAEIGTLPDCQVTIVGTGHPFNGNEIGTHVGSYVDGPYMWHVFVR
jgi:hypothetical protein